MSSWHRHPADDWLCFAQSAPRNTDLPIGMVARIGFVLPRLFTGPTHHNSFFAKYLPVPLPPGQLGLFRTFARPPSGLVPPAPARNWVCFARSPLDPQALFHPAPTKLASFCAVGIGLGWWNDRIVACWVFHRPADSPTPPRCPASGNWVRFARYVLLAMSPASPVPVQTGIGFVWRGLL